MRTLTQVVNAQAASDGAGVKMQRIAGPEATSLLDPFLMLDEFKSDDSADYIGGFPEHPHRGFETITYMKAGRMRHRDHMGNEGVIEAGDVQWMTAGRGVLHSEMPEQESGLMHGFQLWLNLPAREKLQPAAYQELQGAQLTHWSASEQVRVHLIAGEVLIHGEANQLCLTGPLPARTTGPLLMDVELEGNAELAFNALAESPLSAYVYRGSASGLHAGQLGVFSAGDLLSLQAGSEGASVLVIGGRVLGEPIVQHGPFVMNTREEIAQAVEDFRTGKLVQ